MERMVELPFDTDDEARGTTDFSLGLDLSLFGVYNSSGEAVTSDSLMSLTPAWRAVDLLSSNVACLPVDLFIKAGDDLTLADRPAWLDDPNSEQTWQEFVGEVMTSILTDGNAFVFMSSSGGKTREMIVLDPGNVDVRREGGRVVYMIGGTEEPRSNILHIKWRTKPGAVRAMSPTIMLREAIGSAIAAQKHGSSYFGNGAVPASYLKTDRIAITELEQQQLRRAWRDLYGGSAKTSKFGGAFPEGTELVVVQNDNEKSQFIATRAFLVEEIARIYGIPPHLLGHTEKSTSWGTGLAENNRGFAQYTLDPWVKKLENAFGRISRNEIDRDAVVVFDTSEFTADPKTQAEHVIMLKQAGLITLDEAREKLGLETGVEIEPVVAETTGDDDNDE